MLLNKLHKRNKILIFTTVVKEERRKIFFMQGLKLKWQTEGCYFRLDIRIRVVVPVDRVQAYIVHSYREQYVFYENIFFNQFSWKCL